MATPLEEDDVSAQAPTTPLHPTDRRNWVLQSIRLALHVGVILALTLRSAQIGTALHPFARALANEWIHLLFYVETTTRVPVWRATQEPHEQQNYTVVAVTLPHFLLEIEEEIAANVEDEFFNGGFAARASSYPVGMLFTIDETKQHLHGAVANYFRLADIALDAYILAGGGGDDAAEADERIPYPELVVRYENGTETLDASVRLSLWMCIVLICCCSNRMGSLTCVYVCYADSIQSRASARASGPSRSSATTLPSTRGSSSTVWTPCSCSSQWGCRTGRRTQRTWGRLMSPAKAGRRTRCSSGASCSRTTCRARAT